MTKVIDPKLVYDVARDIKATQNVSDSAMKLLDFVFDNSTAAKFLKDETEHGWEFTLGLTVIMDDESAFVALQDATRSIFEAQRARNLPQD